MKPTCIIAALGLHRRMTEDELRHAVGDRVYEAFAPYGMLYNHDAEDPEGMTLLGETRHGESVQLNKRAAESDLLIYVNINMVSMNGGWKSLTTDLAGYQGIRAHHNPKTLEGSTGWMRQTDYGSLWRQGRVIEKKGPRVFQIESTVNTNVFSYNDPLSMLQKRE
ncbi:MAG: lactate racemase domain-containing protein [Acidimicrobiales bacterium]